MGVYVYVGWMLCVSLVLSLSPLAAVEGWIIFVSNINEEAQEEDLHDKFGEYGDVRNMHANLDRRTGFLKVQSIVINHFSCFPYSSNINPYL